MTFSVGRRRFVEALIVGMVVFPRLGGATTICMPDPPCESVLNPNKTAIVGTVLANRVMISSNGLMYEVVTDFATQEVFGADVGSTISVAIALALTPNATRLFLPEGAAYLVYAERREDRWRTSNCSVPTRLAEAARDLDVLRAAKVGAVVPMLSGSVSMTTWDEGSLGPAPNVAVTATRQAGAAESQETQEVLTDAAGRYQFAGLPAGRYEIGLNAAAPLKARFTGKEMVEFHGCKDGISLFITTASFTGTVRDVGGAPVADARIRVVDVDDADRAIYHRDEFTDTDGRWSIDGVPDGRYLVTLNAFSGPSARNPYLPMWYPGVGDANRAEVVSLNDERPRRVDFTVPAALPTGTITGVVFDATGRPAVGASVSLTDAEFPAENAGYATTDAQGRFGVPALVGRRLSIRATAYAEGAAFVSEPLDIHLIERDGGGPVTQEVWLHATHKTLEKSAR